MKENTNFEKIAENRPRRRRISDDVRSIIIKNTLSGSFNAATAELLNTQEQQLRQFIQLIYNLERQLGVNPVALFHILLQTTKMPSEAG